MRNKTKILFQISMTLQQIPSILFPVDTSDFFSLDIHLTVWEMDYIPSVQCCWQCLTSAVGKTRHHFSVKNIYLCYPVACTVEGRVQEALKKLMLAWQIPGQLSMLLMQQEVNWPRQHFCGKS